jgi:PPM family protein phosphatase
VEPRAPAVKVLVCAKTDVGRARSTNEDACSITELATGTEVDALGRDCTVDVGLKGVLLALSDGMGGHQAGEVASALVLESLGTELSQDGKGPIHRQLENAVHRANRKVHEAAKTAERHGMGATLTAVFIRGTEAYIAEVGDSRGYLLRNGRLRQVTRDQSMVQLLVDQGVISPQDARHAPGKNVILQAVGLAPDVRVAIGKLELRRGDRLMLCSDGVSNQITDDELRQIMTDSPPREACETMIALANERGGEDNETVIVADVLGEDLNEPMEFETVTSTFEVMQAFDTKPNKGRRRTPPLGQAQPVPLLPVVPRPAVIPKAVTKEASDPEIEVLPPLEAAAAEPPAATRIEPQDSDAKSKQGWVSSLLNRLSRGQKR